VATRALPRLWATPLARSRSTLTEVEDAMERFSDREQIVIIVALEMARRLVQKAGRVESPAIFDDIETKIRSSLVVDNETLERLMAEAIGDVRWIN
jgi:hypothetical protein